MQPIKLVIFSDTQFPFIDWGVDHAFNNFLSDWKPDIVVMNGDGVDFYGISQYDRDPSRKSRVREELEDFRHYIHQKELLVPGAKLYYNGGNHEDRLRRYLWRKASEIADMEELSLPRLLGIENWQYTPYHRPQLDVGRIGTDLHGLLIVHGFLVRRWSAYTARAHYEKFGGSGVVGHTHRLGAFYHTDYRGEYVWLEGGCMCSLVPEYTISPDWQQGFVAGYLFPRDGKEKVRFDIRQIPIVNKKFGWEGKIYK